MVHVRRDLSRPDLRRAGRDGARARTTTRIVINSFSKYYCMTGWRIGWMVVPERLVRPIERLAQNLYISPPYLRRSRRSAAFDATRNSKR